MMSLDTIRSLQAEARQKAAEENSEPYLVAQEDLDAWRDGIGFPLPFPSIGDYDPPGWEPAGDALFVDTSGLGADYEPALSLRQMLQALEPDIGYAFTEVGQFQAYLQPFRRTS